MTHYQIERRYGGASRDWLEGFTATETSWTGNAAKGLLFESIEKASLALEWCDYQRRLWPGGNHFALVLIRDRRHLPAYVASIITDRQNEADLSAAATTTANQIAASTLHIASLSPANLDHMDFLCAARSSPAGLLAETRHPTRTAENTAVQIET